MSRTDCDRLLEWERLWLDPDWDPVRGYRREPANEREQEKQETQE